MGVEGKKYSDAIGLGPIRDATHPIVEWNRKTFGNYHWVILYCIELFDQYLVRLKNNDISYAIDLTRNLMKKASEIQFRMNFNFNLTPFPHDHIPFNFKIFPNIHHCYMYWYLNHNCFPKKWGLNDPPAWFFIFSNIIDRQIPRSHKKRYLLQKDTFPQKRQKCRLIRVED